MQEVIEFTYNLVEQFYRDFPDTVLIMKASDHNDLDAGIFSKWHMEGDVWTHTMMVVAQTVSYVRNHPDTKRWKELIIAALLHDIGKPACRELKSDKVTCYGHDSVSTFLAIPILNTLNLTHDEKVFILELINYHQILFKIDDKVTSKTVDKLRAQFNNSKGQELLRYVNILRQLDYAGNISLTEDNVAHGVVNTLINTLNGGMTEMDPDKPTVSFLVGLPGCGKSTYIAEQFPGIPVVSRDDIVMELAKPGELYSDAFNTVDQKEVDRLFESRFTSAIANKDDFVIDRTNLSYKGRMKFINRLRPHFNINIIVLLPDMTTVYKRNVTRQDDGKMIPYHVYNIMMKSFNMPLPTEADTVTYVFDY